MVKYFTLFCLLSCGLIAQEWSKDLPANATFEQQKAAFYSYYKTVPESWADDDYSKFKRYEAFMEPRSHVPEGINTTDELLKGANQNYLHNNGKTPNVLAGNWTPLGPNNYIGGITPGVGRLICVTVDPTNNNNVWVGSGNGGIWKSTNAGGSWANMSNNLPSLSVNDIAIDPNNSNNMYLATGDNTGQYSIGVMKSTNGGTTWSASGLVYTKSQYKRTYRVIIDQSNSSKLFVASTDGIWRSLNSGASWAIVKPGNFFDVQFNAAGTNTLYAASDSIYRSVDGGTTWKSLAAAPVVTISFSTRVIIGTTPSNPNVIYVLNDKYLLSKSTDGGTTWSTIYNNSGIGYGTYDMTLGVNPTNFNEVYLGAGCYRKTIDGGANWTNLSCSSNVMHPDQQDITIAPTGTVVYIVNDGGIQNSTNAGANWTNIGNGLNVTEYYRFGCAANSKTVLFTGAQDNGTHRYGMGNWTSVFAGDGTETFVDPTDSNTMYFTTQGYQLSKSTNGGTTFTFIVSDTGSFYMPYVMHPTNNQIIYKAGKMVKKSTDGGWTWSPISPNFNNSNALAVAKSNPNYICTTNSYTVALTTNGGATWSNITSNLPTSNVYFTYLTFSATNPNHIWITNWATVYETTNGGASWTNISSGLPNVGVNCIVYNDNSSTDEVYVGTDLGVYYKDNGMSSWQPYNTNLPNVIVNELEIHYMTGKLRAATYGRGVWESPLNTATSVKENFKPQTQLTVYPNPAQNMVNITLDKAEENIVSVSIMDLTGKEVLKKSKAQASGHADLETSTLSNGVYFILVKTNASVYSQKLVIEK